MQHLDTGRICLVNGLVSQRVISTCRCGSAGSDFPCKGQHSKIVILDGSDLLFSFLVRPIGIGQGKISVLIFRWAS